jgi:hypothetical protein
MVDISNNTPEVFVRFRLAMGNEILDEEGGRQRYEFQHERPLYEIVSDAFEISYQAIVHRNRRRHIRPFVPSVPRNGIVADALVARLPITSISPLVRPQHVFLLTYTESRRQPKSKFSSSRFSFHRALNSLRPEALTISNDTRP